MRGLRSETNEKRHGMMLLSYHRTIQNIAGAKKGEIPLPHARLDRLRRRRVDERELTDLHNM